ncbi:hypothetical protein [Paenibacillus elgii]|uniref:Uncharacterized protein n=1 Tax=Paenibacillus elgii TaxID=189691 RepID=A0A163YZD2_9BACL|nr:hypothetical protein [Paenibacillus elgii]KZE80670.1 hypothetical protein AV654_12080 [Paenibacillus elgii]MCM3270112.1 hypothetical protein [Paenibacillus elgii]NEN82996.1 hypothetical protein [Paenibacillus elgii]PUA40849.1 hypothetical protein C8Z91_01360 [Paenibacillus elgii]
MVHTISFLMCLVLLGMIIVAFMAALLEFVLHDTTDYDMEFLWNHKYTLEDLHLDGRKEEK